MNPTIEDIAETRSELQKYLVGLIDFMVYEPPKNKEGDKLVEGYLKKYNDKLLNEIKRTEQVIKGLQIVIDSQWKQDFQEYYSFTSYAGITKRERLVFNEI